mmetsp:Transcript_2996/g.6357  ORF Transcript_2996/g.6357 Transcript_2996/m.6357 type:complete len:317 (-) Transcript_2996:666-1616(-)
MCVPPRQRAAPSGKTRAAVAAETVAGENMTVADNKPSRKEERLRQIDALNDRVTKLTKAAIANSQKSGIPLDPEYVHAQQPMTILIAGTPVYQLRSAELVYLYTTMALCLIAVGASKISLAATVLSMVTMFVGYDLYSGVLHVVLDHPGNIALPILGQPCLEFQWHHAIPDDLVRKDFVDVCGDLNVVVLILTAINLVLLDIQNASGVAMVVGGMKLVMAYFGQFSHRSAHSFGMSRAPVADWLQAKGFMISPKDHMAHHKPPHDLDFCLIGLCNPVIDVMRSVTTNNALWLALFLVWSIFDVVLFVKFVEWVIGA